MKNPFAKKVGRRSTFLACVFLLWTAAIVFRLVQLQVLQASQAREIIQDNNRNAIVVQPLRGTIYDRKGTILARSVPRKSVFYTPQKHISENDQMRNLYRLKNILGLTAGQYENIRKKIREKAHFIWIKQKIDDEQAVQVDLLGLDDVHMLEEKKRFYPQGRLAAHILGRVNIDEIGQSGMEFYHNDILAGESGKQINFYDAKRRRYRFEVVESPVDGTDLVLTIDETIQYIAEKELAAAVDSRNAAWGTVIISQPQTGEILAMAHTPSFDPNHPPLPLELTDRIRAVHEHMDPGSTFKIITAAAALESGLVGSDESFDCSAGEIEVSGKPIKDHKPFGVLTFPEVFIHSSNVGIVQIARRIGPERFYHWMTKFGFGRKTGIDLPLESTGKIRPPSEWGPRSLPALSIGYELSVTAIQMLTAYNVIANRGILIPPKLVKKVLSPVDDAPPLTKEGQRVLSEETALRIEGILLDAVRKGTGITAQIDGYSIAGKTGTSQKINSLGRYSSDAHTAFFAGYILDGRTLFSMIVIIDNPQGEYYGTQVAAPVFREIATQILRYMGVPGNRAPQMQQITVVDAPGGAR
ncbi:MAG: penicillin-binding protein 2 [Acidobacteria bacterium]|nr:penicillin-binding protein 2 [Acidobacteriota bacterium]MBU1338113.1 penicillin-binding protein 2 [Acidobacteriota bacterium]MBU1473475.1 penicillin-binding protein 2 [Acidobacteriota bacterium]